jgi:hypothetical protein
VEECGSARLATGYEHLPEYAILIAFPRQKWLRERALILRS